MYHYFSSTTATMSSATDLNGSESNPSTPVSIPATMPNQDLPTMSTAPEGANNGTLAEIQSMIEREQQYVCTDYYDRKETTKGIIKGAAVTSRRAKVCRWIFQIVDRARLHRETAIVAVSYLDRFLSSSSPRARRAKTDRQEYELVSMTCLYIAIKIFEPVESMMEAATFSRLSRGRQSERDVIACEYHILSTLRWKLSGPTPSEFVYQAFELLPDGARSAAVVQKLHASSRRQIELAIADYACVPLRRSCIAVASILNSLEELPQDNELFPFEERIRFVQVIRDAFNVDELLVAAVKRRLLDKSTK